MARGADNDIIKATKKPKVVLSYLDSPAKEIPGVFDPDNDIEKEAKVMTWDDIGPVKSPVNITGNHKSSAVWLGEIDGRKIVVKLPGARITRKGSFITSATSGVFRDHGTTPERSLKAEILVQELLSLLGKEWDDRFADVSTITPEDGFLAGKPLLLVEYLKGESPSKRYKKNNPPPPLGFSPEKSAKTKAYRKKAEEMFWCEDDQERQQLAEDARRILLIDLVTVNSDRHNNNLSVHEGRLRAFDQGMAFGRVSLFRYDRLENAILAHTGGSDLRAEERETLERILKSGWLLRVERIIGKDYAKIIRERITWMLENDKLYSEKTSFANLDSQIG